MNILSQKISVKELQDFYDLLKDIDPKKKASIPIENLFCFDSDIKKGMTGKGNVIFESGNFELVYTNPQEFEVIIPWPSFPWHSHLKISLPVRISGVYGIYTYPEKPVLRLWLTFNDKKGECITLSWLAADEGIHDTKWRPRKLKTMAFDLDLDAKEASIIIDCDKRDLDLMYMIKAS